MERRDRLEPEASAAHHPETARAYGPFAGGGEILRQARPAARSSGSSVEWLRDEAEQTQSKEDVVRRFEACRALVGAPWSF